MLDLFAFEVVEDSVEYTYGYGKIMATSQVGYDWSCMIIAKSQPGWFFILFWMHVWVWLFVNVVVNGEAFCFVLYMEIDGRKSGI